MAHPKKKKKGSKSKAKGKPAAASLGKKRVSARSKVYRGARSRKMIAKGKSRKRSYR